MNTLRWVEIRETATTRQIPVQIQQKGRDINFHGCCSLSLLLTLNEYLYAGRKIFESLTQFSGIILKIQRSFSKGALKKFQNNLWTLLTESSEDIKAKSGVLNFSGVFILFSIIVPLLYTQKTSDVRGYRNGRLLTNELMLLLNLFNAFINF